MLTSGDVAIHEQHRQIDNHERDKDSQFSREQAEFPFLLEVAQQELAWDSCRSTCSCDFTQSRRRPHEAWEFLHRRRILRARHDRQHFLAYAPWTLILRVAVVRKTKRRDLVEKATTNNVAKVHRRFHLSRGRHSVWQRLDMNRVHPLLTDEF